MMNETQAQQAVLQYFNDDPVEISKRIGENNSYAVNGKGIEKPYGWVFKITTQKYLEGDASSRLLGVGHVVIERDASIHVLGTLFSSDTELKIYEIGRKKYFPLFIRIVIAKFYIFREWQRRSWR